VVKLEKSPEHYKALSGLLNNLALLYQDRGHAQEAETTCRQAIELLERHGDADSEDLGAYLDNLAMIIARQGRYQEAIAPCERALAIFQKRLGVHHPKIAATIRNLTDLAQRAQVVKAVQKCIVLYDRDAGMGEFYVTNGQGNLSFLKAHSDWSTSWTQIIPGNFGANGHIGLLFYDAAAGRGEFYTTDSLPDTLSNV
jgi:tetratricopeptide (TPR) repeat protein